MCASYLACLLGTHLSQAEVFTVCVCEQCAEWLPMPTLCDGPAEEVQPAGAEGDVDPEEFDEWLSQVCLHHLSWTFIPACVLCQCGFCCVLS